MAMNKTEKAEMEKLKTELYEAKALRFPDYVPNKIDIVERTSGREWNAISNGWTFNVHGMRVWKGWFKANSHGDGEYNAKYGGSQGCGGPWYETERDALMALRIELTKQYAKNLAFFDRKIEGKNHE